MLFFTHFLISNADFRNKNVIIYTTVFSDVNYLVGGVGLYAGNDYRINLHTRK